MKKTPEFLRKQEKDEGGWISIADLMSGLVVIFLLIVVSYSFEVFESKSKAAESIDSLDVAKGRINILQNLYKKQKAKSDSLNLLLEEEKEEKRTLGLSWEEVRSIVQEWKDTEEQIYESLNDEFRDDLREWDAEIERETLTIRFRSPTVLFERNKADLKERFRIILNSFCPRYIALLNNNFANAIEEVRIEGHTSSFWKEATKTDAYIGNMGLSQERARKVLEYCLHMPDIQDNYEDWVVWTVTANGLSSSRLVRDGAGVEDYRKSRRVEFAVKTRIRQRIQDILKAYQYGGLP